MFITVMVSMFRFFQALESFFLRDRDRIGIEGCPRRSQEVKFQPNFGHFSTTPSQSKKWFKQNQSQEPERIYFPGLLFWMPKYFNKIL